MDEFEQLKQTFFQECEELLGSLETQLLALREGGTDEELLHEAFRAIHSIKGGAGAFGFDRLVSFTHTFEAVLDLMRAGKVALTKELIFAAINASDVLADLVRAARSEEELAEGYEDAVAAELAAAASVDVCDLEMGNGSDASIFAGTDTESAAGRGADEGAIVSITYCISFRPSAGMLQRNNEPLLLVRALKELGDLTVTADLSALPDFEDLEPATAYFAWEFELTTNAGRAAVEEIFDFVEGDCELSITDRAGGEQADGDSTVSTLDEPETPGNGPQMAQGEAVPMESSIRVQVDRIDSLVNMVGEIVIAQSMISQKIDQRLIDFDPVLVQGLLQLRQYTQSLQDSVMAIRAQPVRSIFARMPRLVRNLSTQTGKKIRLVTSGEATEIDKTVIEHLNDPLTHMIRNAADHGIEPNEERIARGKPEEGTIYLNADQRGGQIVIEISDDGRGLDRDMIRQRAIERKLISADASLDDDEIDNLIFLPGISTVETVSNISGRGVGMDVVKQNIQKLGGRVSIRSEPGRGSSVVLTLPLTLAVLDGMIIRVGAETLIIPITNIIQSLLPRNEDLQRISGSGEVLKFRGEYITLIKLDQVFGIASDDESSGKLVIVVEIEGGGQAGLVVDEIVGQQQIVIKSLEENFDALPGIAGATILGDGEVALILDVTAVHGLHKPRRGTSPRPPAHDDGQENVQEHVA